MFEHPEWSLEQKEAYAALYKAIEKLPQVQRQAFSMAYLDGLPQQEIADVLQMKLKALESTLQRAKKTLKRNLNFLDETNNRKDFNQFNDK
jgi:RNA polymerase sigma-70 factor (ECF subfamily)